METLELTDQNGEKENNEKTPFDDQSKKCIENFTSVEECLTDLFGDILKRKGQLHNDVEKLQESLAGLISNSSKKESRLAAEISNLRSTCDKLEDHLRLSESYNLELKQNLGICQKENNRLIMEIQDLNERYDSMTWEKLQPGDFENDDPKTKADRVPESSDHQGSSKGVEESTVGKEDKEDCTKFHAESIDLMESWYQRCYADTYSSLMQEKELTYSMIETALFNTLWDVYKFSLNMRTLQLNKLTRNLSHPHLSESADDNIPNPLPKDIIQTLKSLMSKVEIQDSYRIFREKHLTSDDPLIKSMEDRPDFCLYIEKCIQFCRQLVLKSNCLHFIRHKKDENLMSDQFTLRGKDQNAKINKTILPALICFKDGKFVPLRKGDVSSLSGPVMDSSESVLEI